MYPCAGNAYLSGRIACSAVASGELTVSHLGNTQQVHSCRHVVQTNSICAHNHIISSLPTSQQIYILPSPERLRASADNNALLNHNMHLL